MCMNVYAGCDCLYVTSIFLHFSQNIFKYPYSHPFLLFSQTLDDFLKYPISFKTPGDFPFYHSTGSRISSCIFILPAIFQNHMFSLIGFSILLSICKILHLIFLVHTLTIAVEIVYPLAFSLF